jgi:hypothetical protein
VVLEGLAADPKLRVVKSGNAVAQGAESGGQLGRVSSKEFGESADAAAQTVPRGFGHRDIVLNGGKNIGQGGLKRSDGRPGRALKRVVKIKHWETRWLVLPGLGWTRAEY